MPPPIGIPAVHGSTVFARRGPPVSRWRLRRRRRCERRGHSGVAGGGRCRRRRPPAHGLHHDDDPRRRGPPPGPSESDASPPVPSTADTTSQIEQQVLSKVIWEEPRRKDPIGYNGTLQIHPQNHPSPSTITTHPYNTPIPRLTPLIPKRHTDPISRFATIHFAERQTDSRTDNCQCQMVRQISRLRSPDSRQRRG